MKKLILHLANTKRIDENPYESEAFFFHAGAFKLSNEEITNLEQTIIEHLMLQEKAAHLLKHFADINTLRSSLHYHEGRATTEDNRLAIDPHVDGKRTECPTWALTQTVYATKDKEGNYVITTPPPDKGAQLLIDFDDEGKGDCDDAKTALSEWSRLPQAEGGAILPGCVFPHALTHPAKGIIRITFVAFIDVKFPAVMKSKNITPAAENSAFIRWMHTLATDVGLRKTTTKKQTAPKLDASPALLMYQVDPHVHNIKQHIERQTANPSRGKDETDIATMRNKLADGNHRPPISGRGSSGKTKIHTELAASTGEFRGLWPHIIETLDTNLPIQTGPTAKKKHLTELLRKGHTITVFCGRDLNPVLATSKAKTSEADQKKCLLFDANIEGIDHAALEHAKKTTANARAIFARINSVAIWDIRYQNRRSALGADPTLKPFINLKNRLGKHKFIYALSFDLTHTEPAINACPNSGSGFMTWSPATDKDKTTIASTTKAMQKIKSDASAHNKGLAKPHCHPARTVTVLSPKGVHLGKPPTFGDRKMIPKRMAPIKAAGEMLPQTKRRKTEVSDD